MKKNHSRLSARSKHLWGATGVSLFVIANIMLFNDTLSRALLMFMWLLTLFAAIILGALTLWIIVTEIIKVVQRRKHQKEVNREFSDC